MAGQNENQECYEKTPAQTMQVRSLPKQIWRQEDPNNVLAVLCFTEDANGNRTTNTVGGTSVIEVERVNGEVAVYKYLPNGRMRAWKQIEVLPPEDDQD